MEKQPNLAVIALESNVNSDDFFGAVIDLNGDIKKQCHAKADFYIKDTLNLVYSFLDEPYDKYLPKMEAVCYVLPPETLAEFNIKIEDYDNDDFPAMPPGIYKPNDDFFSDDEDSVLKQLTPIHFPKGSFS
ncbi:hypothetical protein ACTOI6_18915 (plasmid) [Komagataeibacter intermedius]|uniref:hypothetical protein n=1 Tax=Komagataeibacter intermedius TaxID=66229 RepID=UPI0040352CE2